MFSHSLNVNCSVQGKFRGNFSGWKHPKHFNQELGRGKALPSPQCVAEFVPQVVPIGKAATSLHTSVNPFSLWFLRLEMKLHIETRCSLCKSQNARCGQIQVQHAWLPGLAQIQNFPALQFSLCNADLPNKLVKYCKLLTVFFFFFSLYHLKIGL